MCVPEEFVSYVQWQELVIVHGASFGLRLNRDRNRVGVTMSATGNTNVVYRWGQPPDDVTQGYLITNATLGLNGGEWTWLKHGRIIQMELWGRTTTGLSNVVTMVGTVPSDIMGMIERQAAQRLEELRALRGSHGIPPVPSNNF